MRQPKSTEDTYLGTCLKANVRHTHWSDSAFFCFLHSVQRCVIILKETWFYIQYTKYLHNMCVCIHIIYTLYVCIHLHISCMCGVVNIYTIHIHILLASTTNFQCFYILYIFTVLFCRTSPYTHVFDFLCMIPALTQGMKMCEQLGNLIERFEVNYPPSFFPHSLSWWTLMLPAMNKDKLFDACMPFWKFIATRQIKHTMHSAHFLYGLAVGLEAALLRCSCTNVPDKKGINWAFCFPPIVQVWDQWAWRLEAVQKTVKHYQDTVSASLAPSALKCSGSWEDWRGEGGEGRVRDKERERERRG